MGSQPITSSHNKKNIEPKSIHINVSSSMIPTKALFSKVTPKSSSIDDEVIHSAIFDELQQQQAQTQSHTPTEQSEQEEDSLSQEENGVKEIKIKWNNFIKMRNQNYLEQYTVIREIGKGGFGTVSKVQSKFTGVLRAAKKIRKSTLAKEEHQKLFAQMAIMINLDHPNITRLFEVYDNKAYYILILQLCEGGQLFTKIGTRSTNQTYAVPVMAQLLKALMYIHSRGIVHRDIKPENMLIQKGSNNLKLIDFGIATQYKGKNLLSTRVGTPYYIAPEVLCKRYGQKCDLWSTGVILYMMITFKPPFSGESELQVMENILKGQPSFKSSSFSKVSQDCMDFLKKLLTKNPALRPSAVQAYEHPWIQKYLKKQVESTNTEAIENLASFKFASKLEAVVYTYIVSQILTSKEKHVLKKMFEKLDSNHDGVISTEEFRAALLAKKDFTQERIKFLVRVIDTNGSGEIDFTEFIVAALQPQTFTTAHFEHAFAYFDIDHSGMITYDEIAAFLEDKENSEEEIRKIFKEVDQNGDGQISKEEFLHILIRRTKERKEERTKKRAKTSMSINKKIKEVLGQKNKQSKSKLKTVYN